MKQNHLLKIGLCLGSQSTAALPCLTQRVEHYFAFQVLYKAFPLLALEVLSLESISPSGQISLIGY